MATDETTGETDSHTAGEAADRLIYFADPMCSWCWGFAPVMQALRRRHGATLPVRLVLGGLAVGTTRALDEKAKATIRQHWEHVAELANQPFDFGFFEREGFVYDTEAACRAVVAARRLSAASALDFLDHLHGAFYARNRDITDRATLLDEAEGFGLDRNRFAAAFDDPETERKTLADFQATRNTGIDGYPALLAGNPLTGFSFVTFGYQPWAKIEGTLSSWLESRGGRRAVEHPSDGR